MIGGRKAAFFVVCALALIASASRATEATNAAFWYWKAIGLLRVPRTLDQLETLRFIEEDLPESPATVLGIRADALDWLLAERGSLDSFRVAVSLAHCDFHARQSELPFPDVSHLARLVALCRRMCAQAQALDYLGDGGSAAEVYRGMFVLIGHTLELRHRSADLAAADMLERVLLSLEGFLVVQRTREELEPLIAYWQRAPALRFLNSENWRAEARDTSRWLLDARDAALRWLRARENRLPRAVLERIEQATSSEWQDWAAEYEDIMSQLADAFELPFHQAAAAIRALEKRREASENAANPLIAIWVPPVEDLHVRLRLAEGQFELARLLCAAAWVRSQSGRWPADPDSVLRSWGLPHRATDPFSAQPITYRLVGGQPLLGIRAPRAFVERRKPLYQLDLGNRARRDALKLREAHSALIGPDNPLQPVAP